MSPLSESPLDAVLLDMLIRIRNRLGWLTGLEVKAGTRIGALANWPKGWKRSWAGAAVGCKLVRPFICINACRLDLDPMHPPTDEAKLRRLFGVVLHEALHVVRGRHEKRHHGRLFSQRCAAAAKVFGFPPPSRLCPAVSWPSIRALSRPQLMNMKKKRMTSR